MVTTGRLRHGIVLALAGLVAGLGIVLGLYGTGGLSRIEQAAQGKLSALSPNAAGPGKDADKPGQETPPQDKPTQDKSAQDKPAQDKVPGAEPGKAAEAAIAPSSTSSASSRTAIRWWRAGAGRTRSSRCWSTASPSPRR